MPDVAQQPAKAGKASKAQPAAKSVFEGAPELPEDEEEGNDEEESSSAEDEVRARWARMRGLAGPDEGDGSSSEVDDEDEAAAGLDEEEEEDEMQVACFALFGPAPLGIWAFQLCSSTTK